MTDCSIKELKEAFSGDRIAENELLSGYTTFKIGGPCRAMLFPKSKEELREMIAILRKNGDSWFVIGKGSNLLVSSRGYDGFMICLRNFLSAIRVEDTTIYAEGGAMMSLIASEAMLHELSGFEFASGIPGTIGGGLFMNAGAYGSELKDVVREAELLFPDGSIRTLSREALDLSYRHSAVEALDAIVLSVTIDLKKGSQDEIREMMADLNKRRSEKQPLEYGSAGSTFKRPEGYFAGKLIEDSGLKGFRIGDAGVSEKHAGFVINYGNASYEEVLAVIDHCRKTVEEKFAVSLETEIRFLGE